MPTVLVTPPALEPVTLAEAKAHLRISHSEEDQLIAALVTSARRVVEARAGVVMIAQQWTCYADDWPDSGILDLPLAPLMAVDEVAVFGEDSVSAAIDPAHYYADLASRQPRLMLRGSRVWAPPGRRINGIGITVTAGYGNAAADVPEPLRQAMLILLGHWYEHRGNGNPPPPPLTLDALVRPYREVRL